MRKPISLIGEAASFWNDNAKLCIRAGTLLPETLSAFIMLARLWARYIDAEAEGQDTIKIVCLSKQVSNGMKSFGMTPDSRKRLGLTTPEESLADLLEDDAE